MMLNYDPSTHGAITAAMVYGTPKQFKVDLAFAFGGYVTADFTRDGLEPFLIGINSYTVWFDERATHDNKSRLKCIRLYLKNRYQPMAEEVYRDGEIKVFESDRENCKHEYILSLLEASRIEDERFPRTFSDYVKPLKHSPCLSGDLYITAWLGDSDNRRLTEEFAAAQREKRAKTKARHKTRRSYHFRNGERKRAPRNKTKDRYRGTNSLKGLKANDPRRFLRWDQKEDTAPEFDSSFDSSYDWEMFRSVKDEVIERCDLTSEEIDALGIKDILYIAKQLNIADSWICDLQIEYDRRYSGLEKWGWFSPDSDYVMEPRVHPIAKIAVRRAESYDYDYGWDY